MFQQCVKSVCSKRLLVHNVLLGVLFTIICIEVKANNQKMKLPLKGSLRCYLYSILILKCYNFRQIWGCVFCFSWTFLTDTITYDDACHLKKYGCNPVRSQLTLTAVRMCSMTMVIDKFHFKNHVDKWCKAHCNPYDNEELKVMYNHIFFDCKKKQIWQSLPNYYCFTVDFLTCMKINVA